MGFCHSLLGKSVLIICTWNSLYNVKSSDCFPWQSYVTAINRNLLENLVKRRPTILNWFFIKQKVSLIVIVYKLKMINFLFLEI